MYNTADFTDLRSSDPNATIKGNEGVFFLADRQLWQQDPTSSHGAGRGIYAGFTYMGAPAKTTPITDYYEGRVTGSAHSTTVLTICSRSSIFTKITANISRPV